MRGEGFAGFMSRESGELRREAEELLHGAHTRGRRDTLLSGRERIFRRSGQGGSLDSHLDQGRGYDRSTCRNLPPLHPRHRQLRQGKPLAPASGSQNLQRMYVRLICC